MTPAIKKTAKHFQENPKEFEEAFAKAWFKLTHRDMRPRARYIGPAVPAEALLWQDSVPAIDYALVDANDISRLKTQILKSGLTVTELVEAAWASAASFRGTDRRGGANGARIRLEPQKDWIVNEPAQLQKVLERLSAVQKEFNDAQSGNKKYHWLI